MKRLTIPIVWMALAVPAWAQVFMHREHSNFGGAYLGVRLRDVTSEDVSRLQLAAETGALIEQVESDSPASLAGLEVDDVVTAIAGLPILTAAQLQRTIGENPAGRTLSFTIVRDGRDRGISVQLGERPGGTIVAPRVFRGLEDFSGDHAFEWSFEDPGILLFGRRPRLGIQATPLTPQMADFLKAGGQEGVLVLQVEKDSPAERAGLRAGDIVTRIDGQTVDSVGALREKLKDATHQLEIVRQGQVQTLTVELEEPKPKGQGVRLE